MHQAISENTSTDHWSPFIMTLLVALIVWSPPMTSLPATSCAFIFELLMQRAALRVCESAASVLQLRQTQEFSVFYVGKHVLLTSLTASVVHGGVSDLSLLRMRVHVCVLQTIQASSCLRVFKPAGRGGYVGSRGGIDGQTLLPACKSAKLLPRRAEWQLMRRQVLAGVKVWAGLAVPAQSALPGDGLIGG